MTDLFDYESIETKTNILRGFKLQEDLSEKTLKVKKYFNEKFSDYFILTEDDRFHSPKFKLFRRENRIYEQSGHNVSLNFIVDVILMDLKEKNPFYVLKNGKIYSVLDEELDEILNGSKEKIKKAGYFLRTEKINDNEFKSVYFNIDKNGNPTTKFSELDWKNFLIKKSDEHEKIKNEIDNRWRNYIKRRKNA